jgi:hypothetical protein
VRLEVLGELKKSDDLIGNRIRDLPACSLNQLRYRVPQNSMVQGLSHKMKFQSEFFSTEVP